MEINRVRVIIMCGGLGIVPIRDKRVIRGTPTAAGATTCTGSRRTNTASIGFDGIDVCSFLHQRLHRYVLLPIIGGTACTT